MKKTTLFLLLLVGLTLASCCDSEPPFPDPEEDVTPGGEISKPLNLNLSATIEASSLKMTLGDNVKLSLKDIKGLEELDKANYKGNADYSLEIEYLIGDKVIGTSSDRSKGFATECETKDLGVGEYTITARSKAGAKLFVKDNITTCKISVVEKTVEISFSCSGHISKDLEEFVIPVLKYTDTEGEHSTQITSDMWKENPFTLPDGIDLSTYNWNDGKFKMIVVPEKVAHLTFGFIAKDGAKADNGKNYFVSNRFGISLYSYAYNGVFVGVSNLDYKIDVDTEEDNIIEGSKMAEYVKKLCESNLKFNILLPKEGGKLNIDLVEK